ncbi:MAG: ABC transporter ATP-binding protein [Oscillibacter sp.]|nr:ABC transporter ATP-binding protein [Oscillibacter sp.]
MSETLPEVRKTSETPPEVRKASETPPEVRNPTGETLLEVRDLTVNLKLDNSQDVAAVDGVSFTLNRGETIGVVGESGCGKTLTASAIIGLLPHTGYVAGGEILFEGEDLSKKSPRQMREIRGRKISMIFQDPMSSLNPVYRIGTQMREALRAHGKVGAKEARELSAEMLRKVGIPLPETRLREYPYQLSGGQRQRVMIAMSLLSNPSLLIADEPTSSLDVTIQAQILELLRALQNEMGTAVILITHDMGVVTENADKILVMYAGRVAEYGPAGEVFARPMHPYTQRLLGSIPRLDVDVDYLTTIEGAAPSLDRMPTGCRFCPRCPLHSGVCHEQEPPAFRDGEHVVFCRRAAADFSVSREFG